MSGKENRKLILHFDVNKTIVPLDSATGESLEEVLNILVSRLLWRKEKVGKSKLDYLSQNHVQQGSARYKESSNFCYSGADRKSGFESLKKALQWNSPYVEEDHRTLTIIGRDNCRYHFILPSFYKLLQYMVKEDRDFVIIFRSFGFDTKNVLESIKSFASKVCSNSSSYNNIGCLIDKISTNLCSLHRKSDDCFELKTGKSNGTSLYSERDIYDCLTQSAGIWGIKDDYLHWSNCNYNTSSGKPLWIKPSDTSVQHIFFDDNIRPGQPDSIVDIRVFSDESPTSFRPVTKEEQYVFSNMNLAPVNLSHAILDEDYFIRNLRQCERNYSAFLEKYGK
ncbi:hypothetical protein CHS0354_024548 [Potamilus streckersoni]|uniref:Uncharacterized protein n=1 Tax=Potamilus streckersoni TaxID=2493646 RepID=A0AAE0TLD4_9BIVA|nr:hypothetical protein CHS0354_024548 [Potamilus streckersoni]